MKNVDGDFAPFAWGGSLRPHFAVSRAGLGGMELPFAGGGYSAATGTVNDADAAGVFISPLQTRI
jgi:hypothetical protein